MKEKNKSYLKKMVTITAVIVVLRIVGQLWYTVEEYNAGRHRVWPSAFRLWQETETVFMPEFCNEYGSYNMTAYAETFKRLFAREIELIEKRNALYAPEDRENITRGLEIFSRQKKRIMHEWRQQIFAEREYENQNREQVVYDYCRFRDEHAEEILKYVFMQKFGQALQTTASKP